MLCQCGLGHPAEGRDDDQVAQDVYKRQPLHRPLQNFEGGTLLVGTTQSGKGVALATLITQAVKRGDVVAVMAEGMPEWLYSDLGTQAIGGVTNGVYTTDSAKQVQYIVSDSNTVVFIAENEEQLDKILEVRDRCPGLKKIVVIDREGLKDFSDPMVIGFDDSRTSA